MALGLELALAFEDSLSRFDVCVCVHVFSFLPVFAGCAFEQAHACGEFLKVCFIPSTANGQSQGRNHAAPGVHRSNLSWFRDFEYERWPSTRRPRHTMKFKQGLDQQWIPEAMTPR